MYTGKVRRVGLHSERQNTKIVESKEHFSRNNTQYTSMSMNGTTELAEENGLIN